MKIVVVKKATGTLRMSDPCPWYVEDVPAPRRQ